MKTDADNSGCGLTSSVEDFGRGKAVVNRFGQSDTTKGTLHFSSANGMPAASYDYFLSAFTAQYNVISLENRGVWPDQGLPDRRKNWLQHVDDLIAFLDVEGKAPYVGMGHSMGGWCTAVAAAKRPDLFSRIILIDPATLPHRGMSFALRNFPAFAYRVPMVKKAMARRRYWDSPEQFGEKMGSKMAYQGFSNLALRRYAEAGLKPVDEGFQLRFSPEWEGHNFSKTPFLWRVLKKVSCPALVLRAEHSYILKAQVVARAMSKMPSNIVAQDLKGLGHLAPQENHELVYRMASDWLAV